MKPRAGLLLAALVALVPGAIGATPGQVAAGETMWPVAEHPQPILRERALRFVPLADGREAVFDGSSMRLVHMLDSDKDKESFLRVTIRILQVTRQHRGIDTNNPFRLLLTANDGLVLEDPLTQSRLAVRAFGENALAMIAPLLVAPATEMTVMPARCPRLEC